MTDLRTIKLYIALILGLNVSVNVAQETPVIGERYALIIGGAGGQPEFTEKYFQQTNRLDKLLLDSLDYKPENVVFLFSDPAYDTLKVAGHATALEVRKAFERFTRVMQPQDQLLLVLIGHGTYDGQWAKFNLVGPDLRDIDYAQMLAALPTKKVVFVNTSSASGPFIRTLSGEQRVIITATKSGTQVFETNFADFFLEALSTRAADFDKDDRVSMLEAFTYARSSQDKWFEDNRRLRAEHPLLDDNGDGDGSQDPATSDDGLLASRIFLEPPDPEVVAAAKKLQTGSGSEMDRMILERDGIEVEIEMLKARKDQLEPEEYAKQLETLLIRLARTNQKIKSSGSENQ